MIRIIQKENLVYILSEPRKEDDLDNTKLLYTFDDIPDIENKLRPFKYLAGKGYKLSLLDYLPEILYENSNLTSITGKEINRILRLSREAVMYLGVEWVEIPGYQILYECDLWNYLEDCYGRKITRAIKEFSVLGDDDKELVRNIFNAPSYQKKLDIARSGNWSAVLDFLPSKLQEELIMFGESSAIGKSRSTPEFRNPEVLGPKFPDLSEEIHKEFSLGEFIVNASEIKERLKEVYERCGIVDRVPKEKDLEEWFTVVHRLLKGKRGIRLELRK